MEKFLIHYPVPVEKERRESQRIYDQQTLQANVARVLDDITSKVFIDGFLLESVSIGTSETLIEHKLNRKVRGWYIVRKNGLGDIYDNIDNTTSDLTRYLPLISSVALVASIVIF